MKKIILILFAVLFLFSAVLAIYLMDRVYFLCPVQYSSDILVRCDGRGSGFFAAERKGRRLHQGLDLWAPVGTPVLASRCGWVIAAQNRRGMGNYIIIRHFGNITTVYGHLSQIYVRKNEFVRQGDVIGAVGKTGNANYKGIEPHLHFEVRKKGVPQDPLEYLE